MPLRLRAMLAFGCAGAGLVTTLVIAIAVHLAASDLLKGIILQQLQQVASQAADRLEKSLQERARMLQRVASNGALRSRRTRADAQRAILDRLQASDPHYAWIGLADAQGTVKAATGKVLEGRNLSERPWWQAGQRRSFIGDAQDIVPLSRMPAPKRPSLVRFIGLATPILSPEDQLAGVLAAYLYLEWIPGAIGGVAVPIGDAISANILIVGEDGAVLVGPKHLIGAQALEPQGLLSPTRTWPDGGRHFSQAAAPERYHELKLLGWTVVARASAEIVSGPARALRDGVFFWGILATAGALLVTFRLAGRISLGARPLHVSKGAPNVASARSMRDPKLNETLGPAGSDERHHASQALGFAIRTGEAAACPPGE